MQSSALSGTALLSIISYTFIGQVSTHKPSPPQASETKTEGIFSHKQSNIRVFLYTQTRARDKIKDSKITDMHAQYFLDSFYIQDIDLILP
jgi:hypothetical protein